MPDTLADAAWAHATALAIWRRLAAQDFAGWDPYDALNAEYLPAALKNARVLRRPLTQLVKRSPLSLQPLLGVKREADPYTLGHTLLAVARLSHGGMQSGNGYEAADLRSAAERLVTRLRAAARRGGEHVAWGYHFPVHTRFFSYEPPTPNLIVTAFVAKGLAAVTHAGLTDCTADLRGAAAFVLGGLPRITDDTGQCIGYVPGESAVVHNANMLAALVLCEAAELAGAPAPARDRDVGEPDPTALVGPAAHAARATSWVDEALACARFTIARQAPDGSWPYSEEEHGRWVDGFHTGFVLEGLARVCAASGAPRDSELQAALDRGVRFYVAQLFGPDGEPKYYPQQARPFDALSAAQGVETLHVALGGRTAQAVPGQLDWIRRHLVSPDGRVAYQVHRGWTDRREFPRWSAAPLMSALAGVRGLSPVGTRPADAFPVDDGGLKHGPGVSA